MGSCNFIQGRKRSTADSPRRLIYHTLKRLIIASIDTQLKISHHIFDFGSIKERIARIYHVRYITTAKLFL